MSIEHPDHKSGKRRPGQPRTGLGELPQQRRRTRRETYDREPAETGVPPGTARGFDGRPVPPPQPPAMPLPTDVERSQAALRDAQDTPQGRVPIGYGVQVTWNARPINATDFRWYEAIRFKTANGGPAINTGVVRYQVPRGYVGILRYVTGMPSDLFASDHGPLISDPAFPFSGDTNPFGEASFLPVIKAGGNTIGGFAESMPNATGTFANLGIAYAEPLETEIWALADEEEFFEVQVSINTVKHSTGLDTFYNVALWGTLLQRTSRELQFEPSNLE